MSAAATSREYTPTYDHLTAILAGMKTAWPATLTSLVVEQTTYTPAQFVTEVTTMLAPFQAVLDARAALQTALKNREDAFADAQKLVNGFYAVLPQYLGTNNADIAKFGKKPPKTRAALTSEQKAEAAAKAKATRAARHTMGKNQKKAIKGAPTTSSPPPPAPAAASTTSAASSAATKA